MGEASRLRRVGDMEDQVLILGSAPDVTTVRDLSREGIDRIVAINNAWRVRPDWDVLIHPKDFPPDRRPSRPGPGQRLVGHADYVPAVNAAGGFVFAGGTMAFTAGYWALAALRPRLIVFLGCDMVYDRPGASHFYGQGRADPLRDDPTLQSLEAKSARLMLLAAEAGCAVVNLSGLGASRLVFPRLTPAALARRDAAASARACARLLGGGTRARIAEARARETALGYAVPSGKYWKEIDRFDPDVLAGIDALWLEAAAVQARAA
jgi:hypothetical protein